MNIFLVMFLVVFGTLFGAYKAEEAGCHTKFASYGKTSYGLVQGCMIETKEGKHVPAEAIREF
jgi:hypothetical protein